jgi:Amidase
MLDRRAFLAACSRLGLTATLLPGVLWALADEKGKVTREMIDSAAAIADVHISDEYKDMMLEDLNSYTEGFDAIYALKIKNDVAPAIIFDPVLPGMKFEAQRRPMKISAAPNIAGAAPKNLEDVAFFSVRQLAELVHTKKVSSSALTEMYIARLKRYDPLLKFVITLTEERALAQAKEADREIAAGNYRGPLHGLPWGAKDLLAVKGYRTTWGAGGFEDQKFDEDATVVKRLDAAGAVLVAKLTLGALAQGDKWIQRIVCRIGFGNGGGLRGIRHRLRDARFNFLAFYPLRHNRPASDIWICPAHRRNGTLLDHGQARATLPCGGRYGDCAEHNPWA